MVVVLLAMFCRQPYQILSLWDHSSKKARQAVPLVSWERHSPTTDTVTAHMSGCHII